MKTDLLSLGLKILWIGIFLSLAACGTETEISSATVTPTVIPIPTASPETGGELPPEAQIIQQVAGQFCAPETSAVGNVVHLALDGPAYSFNCAIAAGHSLGVTIERFPDVAAAQTKFNTLFGTEVSETFRCYPLYEHISGEFPYQKRQFSWQVERWFIIVGASDDTEFGANLSEVSEEIYRLALDLGLLAGC